MEQYIYDILLFIQNVINFSLPALTMYSKKSTDIETIYRNFQNLLLQICMGINNIKRNITIYTVFGASYSVYAFVMFVFQAYMSMYRYKYVNTLQFLNIVFLCLTEVFVQFFCGLGLFKRIMVMLFIVVATFAPDEILIYNILMAKTNLGNAKAFEIVFFIQYSLFNVFYNYSYNPKIMILISIIGGINCVIFTISYQHSRKPMSKLYKKTEAASFDNNESASLKDSEQTILELKSEKLDFIKKKEQEKQKCSSEKV